MLIGQRCGINALLFPLFVKKKKSSIRQTETKRYLCHEAISVTKSNIYIIKLKDKGKGQSTLST